MKQILEIQIYIILVRKKVRNKNQQINFETQQVEHVYIYIAGGLKNKKYIKNHSVKILK